MYTHFSAAWQKMKNQKPREVWAVLTGEIQWTADMTCIFIKGAIAADGMEAAAEHDFSEKLGRKHRG